MATLTLEGTIENGQVCLPQHSLPDNLPASTKVYIVIPDVEPVVYEMPPLPKVARIHSPRLADPKDAERLRKVMVEE